MGFSGLSLVSAAVRNPKPRCLWGLFVWVVLPACVATGGVRPTIPSPVEAFGFEPGAERKLASLEELYSYYRTLDSLSQRVQVRELGKTTEGNPFLLVLVSSEENLARLAEIRTIQRRLADPRTLTEAEAEFLMRRVPAVVSINCSIHATEAGAAQMAPLLVYNLITGRLPYAETILDSTLLLLIPVHNPDGLVIVEEWYDQHLGSKYEGSSPPWLYHKYTGHDNNRDWFLFTQIETQLTVDSVYNVWHPHIVHDLHQMGSSGARMFVPPYVDPVDPNVDPLIVAEMNELGTFVQTRCLEQGLAGVVTGVSFDAFTPARAYPNYHAGIRFLSEVASCRIATPIELKPDDLRGNMDFSPRQRSVRFPQPWTGGRWTFKDVVRYHMAAAEAVLTHAALHRSRWVRNAYRVLKRQCEWNGTPAGFLIPRRQWDPSAADELVRVLRRGGVEVFVTESGLVVPLAQPYGAFAKTLLERTTYTPARLGERIRKPYDVTTHCLPLLFGVRVEPLDSLPPDASEMAEGFPFADGLDAADRPDMLLLDGRANAAYRLVCRALRSTGIEVRRIAEPWRGAGRWFPRGSFVVLGKPESLRRLASEAQRMKIPWRLVSSDDELGAAAPVHLAETGIYQSWVPCIDEGWTRWILEQYGFPYDVIHDQDVRRGALDTLDVLILPHMSSRRIVQGRGADEVPPDYAGGLGTEGVERVRRFVEEGGTLVLLGDAVGFADDFLGLDLCDEVEKDASYYVPGALLRARVKDPGWLCSGLPHEIAALCTTPPLLKPSPTGVLLEFAGASDLLLSGWGQEIERLAGRPGAVEAGYGRGKILAVAFRPQFRSWARGTFKLLFNSLFLVE